MYDFKTALPDGQAEIETFLQERVFAKLKTMTAIIHRNKRQNFANEKVCTPSDVPMKVAQMEKCGLTPLVDLVERSDMVQIELTLESS